MINLKNHTKREVIYLFLILLLLIGFFIQNYAAQTDTNTYKKLWVECKQEQEYGTIINASRYLQVQNLPNP